MFHPRLLAESRFQDMVTGLGFIPNQDLIWTRLHNGDLFVLNAVLDVQYQIPGKWARLGIHPAGEVAALTRLKPVGRRSGIGWSFPEVTFWCLRRREFTYSRDFTTASRLFAKAGYDLTSLSVSVFSPDGSLIFVGQNQVMVVAIDTGSIIAEYDGGLWDALGGQDVEVWDLFVSSIAFHPTQDLVATAFVGDSDTGVIFCDGQRGWQEMPGWSLARPGRGGEAAFSGDGYYFAFAGDTVYLAKLPPDKTAGPSAIPLERQDALEQYGWWSNPIFSSDSRLLMVGSASGVLHCWTPDSGQFVYEQPMHHGRISCLQVESGTKRILSGGLDGSVKLWAEE
jgi:hypothetical protein